MTAPVGGFSAAGKSGGIGVSLLSLRRTRIAWCGANRNASISLTALVGLPDRRHVVQNPHRAAVRADQYVLIVDHDVPNGDDRKVQLQRLPVVARVERHHRAVFSAGIEQPAPDRIFAHDADQIAGRHAGHRFAPALACVCRAKDMRREVVRFVRLDGNERGGAVETRRLDSC